MVVEVSRILGSRSTLYCLRTPGTDRIEDAGEELAYEWAG